MNVEKSLQFPQLEHLYYIEVECDPPMRSGEIDEGSFIIIPIKGGRFEGKRRVSSGMWVQTGMLRK